MVNKVFLLGNLGRDPEVRSTAAGTPVANFTLATNRKWTNRETGERHEETEWHKIVVWGRQAEVAGQYLRRGNKIFLEGRLQTRSWEDRQSGEKRFTTEVVCEDFRMLGGPRDEGGGGSFSEPPHPAETAGTAETAGAAETAETTGSATPAPEEDDDIPF